MTSQAPGGWTPGPGWTLVQWFGGPHDGMRQGVENATELPDWRTCSCHGLRYRASRESWGWALRIDVPSSGADSALIATRQERV